MSLEPQGFCQFYFDFTFKFYFSQWIKLTSTIFKGKHLFFCEIIAEWYIETVIQKLRTLLFITIAPLLNMTSNLMLNYCVEKDSFLYENNTYMFL